ncbi:hypothetical protein D3C75_1122730 [compost metagenome]
MPDIQDQGRLDIHRIPEFLDILLHDAASSSYPADQGSPMYRASCGERVLLKPLLSQAQGIEAHGNEDNRPYFSFPQIAHELHALLLLPEIPHSP